MIGPLAACLIAFTPSPPAHATDLHVEAWEAWQAEQAQAQWQECVDEIHDLNGPYRIPEKPREEPRETVPTRTTSPTTAGVEQWRSLVASIWPAEQVNNVLRVMACESGGNPNAVNPSSGAAGLMQVMPFWWDHYGGDRYDPVTNLTVAYWIWQQQGWGGWTCR